MAFNKVILVGNLVEDPQLKTTPSGVAVVSFSIAVGRRFKSEGQPEADFISVVAWRGTAEFVCKYFSKGKSILVCGQLQSRAYTDKEGIKRGVVEVVADEVSFVGSKEQGQQNQAPSAQTPVAQTHVEPNGCFVELGKEERLPF